MPPPDAPGRAAAPDFLAGGGEMGALMRAHDWSTSPLGDPSTWPQSLRSVVGLMLANRHMMFVAWGPELAFLYNDGYVPVFGAKHPGSLGLPFRQVWSEIWDDIEPLVLKALDGEATWSEDLHLVMGRHGYPEDAWFTFSYSPVRDESGRVAGMFCAGAETTARVLADRRQAFRLALEGRLRDLADPREVMGTAAASLGRHLRAGRCGYAEIDAEGTSFAVDGDWTDGDVPSFAGRHCLDDFGPALIAAFRAGRTVRFDDARSEPLTAGEGVASAYAAASIGAAITAPLVKGGRFAAALYVHAREPRRWTDEEEALVREAAERTWAAVERARAVDALRELSVALERRVEERTRERDRLWELSEDLLVAADYEGHLLRVSPSWTRLLGHDEATLLAGTYDRFIHPDDLGAVMNALLAMRSSGRPVSFENRVAAADGSWRWLAWRLSPEPGGERLSGVGRDVTAARARQADLDAAQEALRQSQKLEAMGQLTGGVAHDFNNLLTPIVGGLDLLQRRGLGGERERRLIDGALQSAERARALVQRLLAFARRQPLQPGAVDVAGLIAGMADLVARTSGPRVKVAVDMADDLPAAKADPNQLEMAVLNLSVNARDAMPDGGTLTISARAEAVRPGHRSGLGPGPYVRLSVADTGVGMDAATLARAVEPFFSTKGVGRGTGLGLSMAHGLASQLGGALLLSSEPGLGTDVELWLPAAADGAAAAPGRAGDGRAPAAAGTALLVDDEELVRASAADMLAELGYAVVEAASAEEALRLVDGGLGLDLLVTDHLMPGMTGADLARAVRGRRPGVPVLVVSGYAEVDGMAPDLPRLAKPFRRADLAASVANLTAGPGG